MLAASRIELLEEMARSAYSRSMRGTRSPLNFSRFLATSSARCATTISSFFGRVSRSLITAFCSAMRASSTAIWDFRSVAAMRAITVPFLTDSLPEKYTASITPETSDVMTWRSLG